jgi:hypothetical protein
LNGEEFLDAAGYCGPVGKGKHTVDLYSPQANTWGCQDQWGNLDITVIPASTGVVAYQIPDKRSGCPSKAGANKALISRTITVGKPAIAIVQGHMIRNAPGRRDLHLWLDNSLKNRTLTYSSSRQWEDTSSSRPVRASLRTRPRTPAEADSGANKALISRTITVGKPAIAIVQGHMIRSAPGRRDLYLYVDGKLKDRTLTFTSSKQWEDAAVYWSGNLGKGKHTIYIAGPNANTWGHLIRNAPGRRDLHLWLDNSLKDRTLTYSSSRQWEDTSSSRPVRVSLRTRPRTPAEAARPRPAPTPRSSRKTSHSASRRSSSPRVI